MSYFVETTFPFADFFAASCLAPGWMKPDETQDAAKATSTLKPNGLFGRSGLFDDPAAKTSADRIVVVKKLHELLGATIKKMEDEIKVKDREIFIGLLDVIFAELSDTSQYAYNMMHDDDVALSDEQRLALKVTLEGLNHVIDDFETLKKSAFATA